MTKKIVLFGATGYTGRKTAAAMAGRGLRPVLVGRDARRLAALAEPLGDLSVAVADSGDPGSLRRLLAAGDVLVTTVGPFQRFGQAALTAALDAGAHYVDSTGEPGFVRRVFETADVPARQAGLTFLTAFGYDYVPGHTAAALALRAAGQAATVVEVGYFTAGGAPFRTSDGTAASLAGAVFDPGLFRRGGRLVEDFGGTRLRSFAIEGRTLDGISVPGSEHLWLADDFPQLQEVGVYLGWFGKRSRQMHRAARMSAPLLRIKPLRALLRALAPTPTSQGRGPDEAELARSGSHIVAEARDARGHLLARIDLTGVDGYTYTARMLTWAAATLAGGPALRTGAVGPIGAFGLDSLVEGNREAGLTAELSPAGA